MFMSKELLAQMAQGREHLKQEAIAHLLGLEMQDIHAAYREAVERKQQEMKRHG